MVNNVVERQRRQMIEALQAEYDRMMDPKLQQAAGHDGAHEMLAIARGIAIARNILKEWK